MHLWLSCISGQLTCSRNYEHQLKETTSTLSPKVKLLVAWKTHKNTPVVGNWWQRINHNMYSKKQCGPTDFDGSGGSISEMFKPQENWCSEYLLFSCAVSSKHLRYATEATWGSPFRTLQRGDEITGTEHEAEPSLHTSRASCFHRAVLLLFRDLPHSSQITSLKRRLNSNPDCNCRCLDLLPIPSI